MAKKRKDKLDKAVEARRAARNSGLKTAPTRVVPDKRRKPPKHKSPALPNLDDL